MHTNIKIRTQRKITETLEKLPKNRAEFHRRREEKEKRLLLKEVREEMWKRWRQTKGRRGSPTISGKIIQEDRLEKELEKVEQELRSYEEEERDRKKRKVKKAEKERHWDMMKWITAYIEENKLEWDEKDKLRREAQEEEET